MTSQIAICNQLGVAIASDTVVTHFNGDVHKTSPNAEKIRTLGGDHLLAIVKSGPVSINFVNTQNIVSAWAATLNRPLDSITEYPTSLIDWITADQGLLNPESEQHRVMELLHDHYSYVARRAEWLAEPEDSGIEPSAALPQAARDALEYLEGLDVYPGTSDEADAQFLKSSAIDLDQFFTERFGDDPGFEEALPDLLRAAPMVLSRIQDMPGDPELGFVGFGATDHFAQVVRVRLRGRFGGVTRALVREPFGADNGPAHGAIATFAQSDAVHGFLSGCHPKLIESAAELLWAAVHDVLDGDDAASRSDQAEAAFRARIKEIQREQYSGPMLSTVAGLSLLGIAELAESLVGIQATFAAANNTGPATVGGFIETLVISRQHGLQWMRRLPGAPTT